MTCHIIGCGLTGQYYKDEEAHYVIGVNDANKFGYYFNELLFLNRPRHFNEIGENMQPRLNTILHTNFGSIACLSTIRSEWMDLFPGRSIVPLPILTRWAGHWKPMTCYHTNNSPFTAMSYATLLGFKEIVLWGVDFIDHKHITAIESVPAFSEFSQAVQKQGINIYKGHHLSKLNLPVWKSLQ